MSKEDLLLHEEMGRLEIQHLKVIERKNENPFILAKTGLHTKHQIHNVTCTCASIKKNRKARIHKKKNKILNEPVLQVIKGCISNMDKKCQLENSSGSTDSLNLCTLVSTCNQLKISSGSKEENASTLGGEKKWWKQTETAPQRQNKEVVQHSQTGSCSQQVLNPPCDVTIDELASYFETLVHIPKKMSSMAEMMYI